MVLGEGGGEGQEDEEGERNLTKELQNVVLFYILFINI